MNTGKLNQLGTRCLDLLFPVKCPFCQAILDNPRQPLCPRCQPALPWLAGGAAQRTVDFADLCVSPLAYRGAVREAIHRYKFHPLPAYGAPFAALLAQCFQTHMPESPACITWVPLSAKRRRKRGFDQAQLLAQRLGDALGLPVLPTLNKVRHTQPQSGIADDAARRGNALGAYAPMPQTPLQGKRVVLVDDVVTSGATLSECARLLRQEGAEAVYCLTLAKAGDANRANYSKELIQDDGSLGSFFT